MIGKYGEVVWFAVSTWCDSVKIIRRASAAVATIPKALDAEHPIDPSQKLQLIISFIETCVTGVFPGGRQSSIAKIPATWFSTVFNAEGILSVTLPRVTSSSPEITSPVQRMFEAFGSYTNVDPFLLAEKTMNQIKGAFAGFGPAIAMENLDEVFYDSIGGDTTAIREHARQKWMTYIQKSIALFGYLKHTEFQSHLDAVVSNVRTQLALTEQNTSGGGGLVAHWDEFWYVQKEEMSKFAQQQVRDQIMRLSYLVSRTRPANTMVWTVLLDT
ncbi:uncharacterized protein C8A04DRAFT_32543 [Dichotomopilus funicola]|uniref:Uncharacterized protein n=1 Tax=Dichotomopilus funicola TaxID=1934379 RepID=A0AAN6ZIS3_9PEZI|nr:hypothetical protein C8A04DRAFT_32543 [Dichotomopilus funicola]